MSAFMQPAPAPQTSLGLHRPLSATAGIRVSPLILGGMSIGESWSSFMGSMTKDQAFKLLDAYAAAGGNFIDTANVYQEGESESWIGEWMKGRKNRDEMVIATKYSFNYGAGASDNQQKTPGKNNHWGNHKRSMYVSLRDSLSKLQTDWVDIFYVHLWDYASSIEEVMDALHILVQERKVMYLGISDTPAWVVAGANHYARAHGKTPFSIYQGHFNVLTRDLEREVLPMTRYFGMAIAAWAPLRGGKFRSAEHQGGDHGRSGMEQSEVELNISEALLKVAKAHNMTSVTAIALAYVRAKAPNMLPIVGGRKVEHLMDNIKSLDVQLTAEEVKYLEDQNSFDLGFPGNFIGQDWRISGEPSLSMISQGPIAVGPWL